MKKILQISLSMCLVLLCAGNIFAQSSITFQVNLKPQLEDSTFIPGRDAVKLTGNMYPVSRGNITLKDTAPKDSVYSVKVTFPRTSQGKKLSYNFVLNANDKTIKESMPRLLDIRSADITLDALYFDSFAW